VLARRWPDVRIAWKDEVLHVVGGPQCLDELLDELVQVAAQNQWTPYERGWTEKQKQSTRQASALPLAQWQAEAAEDHLELFVSHIVPRDRAYFNPLLGSGGNAGKRAFSDGWKKAVAELRAESANPNGKARKELHSLLMGGELSWLLEKLNAASWFSDANKLYNSGQNSYREGRISPWAMALACEGLTFFAGAASRRLGSRARSVGAFPFVTQAAAPTTAGEAGRDTGEVWAPFWERPMTFPEVRALFARGRAEVRGKGALTPAAFATAIVERGIDAGIVGFLRFSLGRTTSANTFEPRFEGRVTLSPGEVTNCRKEPVASLASVLERLLALTDQLPRDEKKGKRWRFVGLRGPIERAIVQLAATPSDPEAACGLLDAVVAVLDKVDRNQAYRARQISWEPLPVDWLPALFGSLTPPPEAQLALAAVSGFPASRPFALYRFGVEWRYRRYVHPKQAPLRWVWGAGQLSRVLTDVLTRRVLDWERASKQDSGQEHPARLVCPVAPGCVDAWLAGEVDEPLMERWLSRLALFDWSFVPGDVIRKIRRHNNGNLLINGQLAMFGLFQPLFDHHPVQLAGSDERLLEPETGARTPAAARHLVALARTGQIESAVAFAMSRYAMGRTSLIKARVAWAIEDPERLLASLLFAIPQRERGLLLRRWLRPRKEEGEIAYA
jgi:CRISPR-associated protein Csx17